MLHVGLGAWVPASEVIAVLEYHSEPLRQLVQRAREDGRLLDGTYGRRTRSLIRMRNGDLVLSSLTAETVASRLSAKSLNVHGTDLTR